MNIGHWACEFDFDPSNWFGFIYRIVELNTGKEYIGKKQFTKLRRKVVKGRQNRKHVKSDSDWKTYTGSSEHLNAAMEKNNKDQFLFIIESLHKTKGSLHYAEIQKQVFEDVLRAMLPDGSSKRYYNKQIAAIRYMPPAELEEEIRHKMKICWTNLTAEQKTQWYAKFVTNKITTIEEPVVKIRAPARRWYNNGKIEKASEKKLGKGWVLGKLKV